MLSFKQNKLVIMSLMIIVITLLLSGPVSASCKIIQGGIYEGRKVCYVGRITINAGNVTITDITADIETKPAKISVLNTLEEKKPTGIINYILNLF